MRPQPLSDAEVARLKVPKGTCRNGAGEVWHPVTGMVWDEKGRVKRAGRFD